MRRTGLVDARVVSIYGGVSHAGQNQIVAINRGSADGIDIGTALELSPLRPPGSRPRPIRKAEPIKLPDERYGTLFMFRVFGHVSYGLIMQVTDTVQVGDVARSPE